ncbi:MAG: hypothetical protein OXM61_11950 [Candidatus Poribacteria bacterium]|nr:hypothetical protein [Candidatus Poribacteria bacterium]
MYRKLIVLGIAFLMILSVMPRTADAQDQILGPWLWMIAKTEAGQGGANSTDIDSLAVSSDNKVTEEMVAKNGAKEGDTVGDYKWTLAELPANGDINTVVNETGMAEGALDDVSSYALYTYKSDKAQDVTMKTGSDDSIKVWLNGEVVFTNAVNRGRGMWQDEFGISLKQGDNLILVKVSERGGGWGMHVGILETPYVPVVDILTNWLWMIARAESGQGGAAATDVDLLAVASKDVTTEDMVAEIGASEGDSLGDYDWTLAELPQNGNLDEIANLMEVEGGLDDITAYGLVTLVADETKEVTLLAGSDDSIKVWLNGEVVHTNAVNRGRSRWQDEFTVNLRQGDNLLLVKVSDRGGGWGMHFGIRGEVETAYKTPAELGTPVEAKGKLVTTWGSLKSAK